jgi:hypothetical protein
MTWSRYRFPVNVTHSCHSPSLSAYLHLKPILTACLKSFKMKLKPIHHSLLWHSIQNILSFLRWFARLVPPWIGRWERIEYRILFCKIKVVSRDQVWWLCDVVNWEWVTFLFKRQIVRKQNIAQWIGHGKPVVRQR